MTAQPHHQRFTTRAFAALLLLALVAAFSAQSLKAGSQPLPPSVLASAAHSTIGALDLCRATFQAAASVGGIAVSAAPPSWVVLAALTAGGCGAAIGTFVGHVSASTICWLAEDRPGSGADPLVRQPDHRRSHRPLQLNHPSTPPTRRPRHGALSFELRKSARPYSVEACLGVASPSSESRACFVVSRGASRIGSD
jgi:hypothetical protein